MGRNFFYNVDRAAIPEMTTRSRTILLGLDFGSTTSHALLASARIVRNCVTGRMELGEATAFYRSEPVFTPFLGDLIDEERLSGYMDQWISESKVEPAGITAGGAIVTGLAAQKKNAKAIGRLVRERIGDAVVAIAEDPCLESWVAFMGSCGALSEAHPGVPFLNLDIGGGTTNLALGSDGQVTRTGCTFVGARHVQVVPGTYRICGLSRYATRLLDHLGIRKGNGDMLESAEVGAILDFYVSLLEALVTGRRGSVDESVARFHEQVRFTLPPGTSRPVITLSGGVGELVYRKVQGRPMPATTAFGDLGIDLAERIVRSPVLSQDLATHTPVNLGRATVYGLTLHNTEVSGTTLYLPRPEVLPLRDLPILARLGAEPGPEEIAEAVEAAGRSARGACIQMTSLGDDFATVKRVGGYLAEAFRKSSFPDTLPLVLFVPRNVGMVVGSYATDWGNLGVNLIVIDELSARNARFASLGAPSNGVVPVSFYGMHS